MSIEDPSPVAVQLTPDEALVLFEFLQRFSETDALSIQDQAEKRVLWNECCSLEKFLSQPSPRTTRISWRKPASGFATKNRSERTEFVRGLRVGISVWPNPSIERTSSSKLRLLPAAAHVKR